MASKRLDGVAVEAEKLQPVGQLPIGYTHRVAVGRPLVESPAISDEREIKGMRVGTQDDLAPRGTERLAQPLVLLDVEGMAVVVCHDIGRVNIKKRVRPIVKRDDINSVRAFDGHPAQPTRESDHAFETA